MSRSMAALILLLSTVLAQAAPPPSNPHLLLDPADVQQLRQKLQSAPWKSRWSKHLAALNKEIRKPLNLPPRGGNWSHNYVCPTHGARLTCGKSVGPWQWEHHCRVGPHTLLGDPSKGVLDFDGNAIRSAHGNYAQLTRDLGVAYQITGDRRFADHARAILLAYADKYLSYPLHDNQGRPCDKGQGGRVASQSLTEATWLIVMVHGADLVWDTFSPEQRDTFATKLLRPAIDETILNKATRPVIHNIQCHRNSAVGLVGFLLNDKTLIHEAIDGIHGYRANMAKGVLADGAWYEGAWGYHFYTIDALWPLTEAARHHGVDLYGPELKRLYQAPLNLAMPNFRLPAFNDSIEVDVLSRADSYELAYARYKDPAFAAVIAQGKRSGELALLYGVPQVTGQAALPSNSRNAQASGYAILQHGADTNATWLCLKYGEHGGGHGHFDKNNLVLYSRGKVLMPDTGTHAYGSEIHKSWDKNTFAHSTLVVDQADQKRATGKCLAFGAASGADYAMTDAGAIYPGVRFVRTVAMLDPDTLLVIDHVSATKPRTLDLVSHITGTWKDLPQGSAFELPSAKGYNHVRDATTRRISGNVVLDTGDARIVLAANDPTELITGTGPLTTTEDRVPLTIFRRSSAKTVFVWAISLKGDAPTLEPRITADAATVIVKASGQTWQVTSNPTQSIVRIENK